MGGPGRRDRRDRLLARRGGPGGARVRRAVQRQRAGHDRHTCSTAGWERTARLLGADPGRPRPARPTGAALARRRRDAVFGPAMEPLSYAEPIEMASASGVWMTDADGRRYLDMYNNVVCVGHAHPARHLGGGPAVAGAQHQPALPARLGHRACRAAGRDLPGRPGHGAVRELGLGGQRPRLAARPPPHRQRRRPVHRVRLPRHHRRDRGPVSPRSCPARSSPPHVETWAPPDTYRGLHLGPTASRPRWIGWPPAASPRPRPSSTGCCRATASTTSTRPTCRNWCG